MNDNSKKEKNIMPRAGTNKKVKHIIRTIATVPLSDAAVASYRERGVDIKTSFDMDAELDDWYKDGYTLFYTYVLKEQQATPDLPANIVVLYILHQV